MLAFAVLGAFAVWGPELVPPLAERVADSVFDSVAAGATQAQECGALLPRAKAVLPQVWSFAADGGACELRDGGGTGLAVLASGAAAEAAVPGDRSVPGSGQSSCGTWAYTPVSATAPASYACVGEAADADPGRRLDAANRLVAPPPA